MFNLLFFVYLWFVLLSFSLISLWNRLFSRGLAGIVRILLEIICDRCKSFCSAMVISYCIFHAEVAVLRCKLVLLFDSRRYFLECFDIFLGSISIWKVLFSVIFYIVKCCFVSVASVSRALLLLIYILSWDFTGACYKTFVWKQFPFRGCSSFILQ